MEVLATRVLARKLNNRKRGLRRDTFWKACCLDDITIPCTATGGLVVVASCQNVMEAKGACRVAFEAETQF
jgi:hypothetical protein